MRVRTARYGSSAVTSSSGTSPIDVRRHSPGAGELADLGGGSGRGRASAPARPPRGRLGAGRRVAVHVAADPRAEGEGGRRAGDLASQRADDGRDGVPERGLEEPEPGADLVGDLGFGRAHGVGLPEDVRSAWSPSIRRRCRGGVSQGSSSIRRRRAMRWWASSTVRRVASVGCAVRTGSTRRPAGEPGDERRPRRPAPRRISTDSAIVSRATVPRARSRGAAARGGAARRCSRAGRRARTPGGRASAWRCRATRGPARGARVPVSRARRASARMRSSTARSSSSSCSTMTRPRMSPSRRTLARSAWSPRAATAG